MVQLDLSVFRLSRRLTRAAACIVALTGCSLSTPPAHDEVVTRALPESTAIPPAWQADPGTADVAGNWLKSLHDPVLDGLVREALANNPDLRQAAQRVTIANQSVIVAGAPLLPQVGVVAGARSTRDDNGDTANTTDIYAGVAWELDVWGRLRAQRAASAAQAAATKLDYAWARQSLAATVAKAWYLTTGTWQSLALAEQSVDVFDKLLKLVTVRRTAGKTTDLDVADARANLATAQAAVETARQHYGEARRALELLLGRYPGAEIEAAQVYPPLGPPVGAGIPSTLLDRRPDIKAAEREVLAAFRLQEAAQLALLPDFSISLVGGRLDDQLLSAQGLSPWLGSAAIGASLPVYAGGALRAQIQITTARQVQAAARYGAVTLGAFREVENALANEQLLARRLTLVESALRARSEAVRIATIQYRAGSRDLLWVSSLQSDEIATRQSVIRLRALQRINRIQLYLALGGSFGADEAAAQSAVKG